MSGCTCAGCIRSCRTNPGWFLPGEAEGAAAHLALPFDEFRDRFLVRVHHEGTEMLAPAKVSDPGGCPLVEGDYRFHLGPCVFLQDGERCAIHSVKPAECREGYACQPGGGARLKSSIARAWRVA